jgi:glycosyltransferase involved in cell wall biosynthesis
MLNLRTSGIYHTDFPEYIRILTEDSYLESLAWTYMHWFYGQQDTIYVNSEQYRRSWAHRGIDPDKLKILPRGLDIALFHPDRRDPSFWRRFGADPKTVRLLYAGRVSKEKDLDVLSAAYEQLRGSEPALQLCIVGDGPYATALGESVPDAIFTGYLAGEELATAYASADIFLFPSTTDTFGNVIIEAQASGLPVIVSDAGGPQELVEHGVTGLITKARDVPGFAAAVHLLASDAEKRLAMGRKARESVLNRSWPNAFRAFWATTAG